jgi:hypothetical protein
MFSIKTNLCKGECKMGITPDRKMVPCYLDLGAYFMLKSMADEDMRSMSGFLKVLVYEEGAERGLKPEMFREEANKLLAGKEG